MARRLDRLEKLVFGDARQGTNEERLANLMSAVPVIPELSRPVSTTGGAAPKHHSSTLAANPSDYPAVSTLENQILGAPHKDDQIRTRLDRLETKAFGNPSKCDDLSLRVSELQEFARDKGFAPQPATVTYVPPPPKTATIEEKVTWLEQQVYGRTVADGPMFQRIHRLNLSILPHEYLGVDGNIPDNVSELITAVELDQATALVDADGQTPRRFHPLPLEHGKTNTKLNKTAATLDRMGMPTPLSELGIAPGQTTNAASDDDDDSNSKKKKKGSGFLACTKRSSPRIVRRPLWHSRLRLRRAEQLLVAHPCHRGAATLRAPFRRQKPEQFGN